MTKVRLHTKLYLFFCTVIVCGTLLSGTDYYFYDSFRDHTYSSKIIQCCGNKSPSCTGIINSIFPIAVRKRAPAEATFATTIVFIGDSHARHAQMRTVDRMQKCFTPTDAWRQSPAITEKLNTTGRLFFYEAFTRETTRRRQRMLVRLVRWSEVRLASLQATLMKVVNVTTQAEEELRGIGWRDSRVLISIDIGTWDAARPDMYLDGHNFTYMDFMRPPPRLPISNDPALQPLHLLTVEDLMKRFGKILLAKTEEPLRKAVWEIAQLNLQRVSALRSRGYTLTMLPPEYVILFSYPVRFNCSSPARFFSERVSRKDDPYKYLKSLERCRRVLLPAWVAMYNVVDKVVQGMMDTLRASDIESGTMLHALDMDSFAISEGKDNAGGLCNRMIDRCGVCYAPDGVHLDDTRAICREEIQNAWWKALPKGTQL